MWLHRREDEFEALGLRMERYLKTRWMNRRTLRGSVLRFLDNLLQENTRTLEKSAGTMYNCFRARQEATGRVKI